MLGDVSAAYRRLSLQCDQQWICQQNIERFRTLYTAAGDERRRATLSALLTEELAKLKRIESALLMPENARDSHQPPQPEDPL